MRYGIEAAPWGEMADPRALARLATVAEVSGWDGFFLWDGMLHDPDDLPKADPWIALAAIALATERIRFGPMVTPLPPVPKDITEFSRADGANLHCQPMGRELTHQRMFDWLTDRLAERPN